MKEKYPLHIQRRVVAQMEEAPAAHALPIEVLNSIPIQLGPSNPFTPREPIEMFRKEKTAPTPYPTACRLTTASDCIGQTQV